MPESTCVHCGKRIVRINYGLRNEWTHQPAGAAFQDGQHTYCHLSVATPATDDETEDDQ